MKKGFLLSLVLVAATARAESLEEKKYWKAQMDYVQSNLDSAAEYCGVKFTFDWVSKPKLRAEAEKGGYSPNGICSAIVDEVASICRDGDDEKKAVTAKIKGFRCGFAKNRTLEMKGGIVTYMGNNDQPNFSTWARPWLLKRL